ncbi:IS4 family transposase [Synechocystis sp. LKSZ1]|uniref:IS4 family transposase n=1 Tax=Synechocystis sp. LKSZ1 TaxID=3144951 RepID=UPI00336BF732
MTHSKDLQAALQPHFSWHGARLAFLSLFLVALFKVQSVSLSKLSKGFESEAKPSSSEKRLSRFFADFDLDYQEIAQMVVTWMKIPQPWVLSLDRTTWEFGNTCHNLLVLALVHEGIAYPLMWEMLDKKGNSNQRERIELMERFSVLFPDAAVAFLAGDREFIGQVWTFYLLLEPQQSFRLRIRKTDKITHDGKTLAAGTLLAHLQVGEKQRLSGSCKVWGCAVMVEALRLPDGQLLTVVAPVGTSEPLQDYAQRWNIETWFGAFKTRGFCIESTHFKDPERLSKLFALLTLALCWAMQTGRFIAQHTPIPIKNHGRKAKSVFRTGFDHLQHLLLNPTPSHRQALRATFSFLSGT